MKLFAMAGDDMMQDQQQGRVWSQAREEIESFFKLRVKLLLLLILLFLLFFLFLLLLFSRVWPSNKVE